MDNNSNAPATPPAPPPNQLANQPRILPSSFSEDVDWEGTEKSMVKGDVDITMKSIEEEEDVNMAGIEKGIDVSKKSIEHEEEDADADGDADDEELNGLTIENSRFSNSLAAALDNSAVTNSENHHKASNSNVLEKPSDKPPVPPQPTKGINPIVPSTPISSLI